MNTKYTAVKKMIFIVLILIFLPSTGFANIAQELIQKRAETEKAAIEAILGRFRSWYQLEKLNGNNPDTMALPLEIFGDTTYGASHSYSEGKLTLNLEGLPSSVLTALKAIMRLQNIGGNLQISMERDGTNTGTSIDTSNLIQRSGGTFLPGANLTFTSGGILMPSGTTLNVKSLNIDGIDINDLSGITIEGAIIRNPLTGTTLTAGTVDNPMPIKGSIASLDGTSVFTFTDSGFGSANDKIKALGYVTTPFGQFVARDNNGASLNLSSPNFSIGEALQITDDAITIGDTNKEMYIRSYDDNIYFWTTGDIRFEADNTYFATNQIEANNTEFNSDVVFTGDVRFTNRVFYDDYIVAEDLNLTYGKKLSVGDFEITGTGIKTDKNLDIEANSLKINGKDVVTADAKVLVSMNRKLDFSQATSLNTLSGKYNIEEILQNNGVFPPGGMPLDPPDNGTYQYEISAGVKNIRTETPLSVLPNLQNAITYRSNKRINAQLFLPEGEDGIKIYLTKLRVPLTHNNVIAYKNNTFYAYNLKLDSISNISSVDTCEVYSSSGNPLPLIVSSYGKFNNSYNPLESNYFEVWQPFPVFSGDVSNSDIFARSCSNGKYYLTPEEEELYNIAISSGEYVVVDSLNLVWITNHPELVNTAFITVDEPYTALGTTVNNINKIYERASGTPTETYYNINPVIPNDTISINSNIYREAGNQSLNKTATITYNNNYWKNLYNEIEYSEFDVVNIVPVENPSYVNNITVGCGSNVYIIAPPTRYNDKLAGYLQFSSNNTFNTMLYYKKIPKIPGKTDWSNDLYFAYGVDYTIQPAIPSYGTSLFYGYIYNPAALEGKLFDVEIDVTTTKKLVLRRDAPSTVNLVKTYFNNEVVHQVKEQYYGSFLGRTPVPNTITTTAVPTESARLKHLKYDIVHDNLVLKSILLPITYFQSRD